MKKKIVLTDEDKASLKKVAETRPLEILQREHTAIMIIEDNINTFTYNHELKSILLTMLRQYEDDLIDVIIDKKEKDKE